MITALFQAAQGAPTGAPLPWLSYGALLALIAGAVGYGRVMQTVKSTSEELRTFKHENNDRLLRIETTVNQMSIDVGKISDRAKLGHLRSAP